MAAAATTNKPIAVVRIPRTYSNQIAPTEVFETRRSKVIHAPKTVLTEYPEHDDESLLVNQERHIPNEDSFRTRTDVFTLAIAPSLFEKSHESRNEHVPRQKRSLESSRSSPVIQQQPERYSSLIKPSPKHYNRPNENWKAKQKWQNGLCSLCDDFNIFCYACSCWCCFRHELTKMMDEHWILWFVTCSPLMALRTKFRQQYRIRGSIAEDCCLANCCPLCVGLQIANEGRHYGHRIFI